MLSLLILLGICLATIHGSSRVALALTFRALRDESKYEHNNNDDIGSCRKVLRTILVAVAISALFTIALTLKVHHGWLDWLIKPLSDNLPAWGPVAGALAIETVTVAVLIMCLQVQYDISTSGYVWLQISASAAIVSWIVFPSWLTVDILALLICGMIIVIAQLRLSFFSLTCALLVVAVLYDAVQVFVTGNMVKSVGQLTNASVVQGTIKHDIIMPYLVSTPRYLSWVSEPEYAIGTADIVVSGIMVVTAAHIANRSGCKQLYRAALIGFVLGFGLGFAAMHLWSTAQPATIYLVPAIAGCVIATAIRHGQWSSLKAKPFVRPTLPGSSARDDA